jgi:hypothetical protein
MLFEERFDLGRPGPKAPRSGNHQQVIPPELLGTTDDYGFRPLEMIFPLPEKPPSQRFVRVLKGPCWRRTGLVESRLLLEGSATSYVFSAV